MTAERDLATIMSQVRPLDLSTPRDVHIVGIAGTGMRAIARVLMSMGHRVSGSDRAGSHHVDMLRSLGATVHVGHDPSQLGEIDIVTRSTAVPDTNPEVEEARSRGVRVSSRAEVLAAISAVQPAILVAGTHGKTTTSSMLASILEEAGLAPSFIIGADVARFGTGARWVAGSPMVIEADESDGTFVALTGAHAVVTSLDPDHLDFYGSQARLNAAFSYFADSIPGFTAVCLDDPDTSPLVGGRGVVTYGTAEGADLQVRSLVARRTGSTCELWYRPAANEPARNLGEFEIALPGLHNALNAAGAAAVAIQMGVDGEAIRRGLASLGGVARRFELRGEAAGVTFIDDYAHLPAEVEAAISAACDGRWNRVVVTYQPHRYSRTQALGHSFAQSFEGADHLVLTGIYPSGEAPRPEVTGRIVLDAVLAASDLNPTYAETLDDVVGHLNTVLEPGDLCLTLGAGDLTTIPDRLIASRWRGWADELRASLTDSVVLVDEPLGARTTYRVGGPARLLVEVNTFDDLSTAVAQAREVGVELLTVGRGSNMLVADSGFDGLAIALGTEFESVEFDGATVTAGSAVALPALARQTVAAGLTGFEWAVGVPGTIGGAVVMNAGGHGSDIAASLAEARVLNLATGRVEIMTRADLAFGYRCSSITSDHIVLSAQLRLGAGDPIEGESELREIVQWRRENQPGGQNAGSVFTNPPGDSAGRLIDIAGCKGRRVGSAEVSTKHANFIQVDPGGSADDVFDLMVDMASQVAAAAGVRLEPETRLVGFPPFRKPAVAADPSPRGVA